MFTGTFCNFIIHDEEWNDFVSLIKSCEQRWVIGQSEISAKPEDCPFAHGMIQLARPYLCKVK
jgi:predicted hydrocarbon binding protein